MQADKGNTVSHDAIRRRSVVMPIVITCLLYLAAIAATAANNSLKVLDISERAYDGGNALAVTFNLALDSSQNIDNYLRVSHAQGLSVDGSWVLSDDGKLAYFEHVEPKTRYIVRIYPGLISSQGVSMRSSAQQTITTRDITPSAVFASSGHFLPATVSEGLVVNSVNVSEVNIDFIRIKPENIAAFLQQTQQRRGSSWHSYYLDQAARLGTLIYSGRYQLRPAANKRGNSTIAVDQIAGINLPGIYLAVMSVPGKYRDNRQVSYFTVTDLGMHARVYDNQIDIHVSSIASGAATAGATISLHDSKGRLLGSEETTMEGYASLKNASSRAYYITARHGEHFSFLQLNGPALDLSEFELGKKQQRNEEIFIYAPRDLYRPGETIDISALRRDGDGKPMVGVPLSVKILRPDKVAAHSFTWHTIKNGYYQYQYKLPVAARPGNWVLQVTGIDRKAVEYEFKVEEFLPERMELEFNHGSEQKLFFDESESIRIPVTGRYLYGAPADGNRVSSWVRARKAKDIVDSLRGYEFGHADKLDSRPFEAAEIKLDKLGNGVIELPAKWRDSRSALQVTLTSSLYETGGRPINRVYKSYVWPESAMIGIRPDFGDENPDPNSQAGFKIVKSTSNGELLAVQDLEVTLIREDRSYFWEYNDNQGWHWQWTDKEFPVYTQTIGLDGRQPEALKVPVEYGRYRLEVLDRDNNNQLSSLRFHAGRDWYYWWRKSNEQDVAVRPDQVSLAFDAEAYKAGDIARLRVVSPHAGQAIITVESDRMLWFSRTQIDAQGSTVEIPVDEDWQHHNIYVSAVVFKAADSANVISPNRAIGVRHLPLYRKNRQLAVEIESADKILPDRTHQFRVRVTGNSEPKQSHVTLAAVDVGVLAISSFDTPDPFDAFFGQRRYAVDQRDMYARIIALEESQRARLRFGGDAALARGGEAAKADVQIVSLFSGLVDVDAEGFAEVSMDIPDFNGSLRLMALAFNEESFGSADRDVTVAAPVVTQLSMPRFLAFNDTATLALDVTNLSGKAQSFKIDLETTTPLRLISPIENSLVLKDKEKRTLRFDLKASEIIGRGEIKFQISDEQGQTLNKSWKLAVRSAYPAVTESVASVLDAGDSIDINDVVDLDDYTNDSLQALISVSTEANLRLQEQLKQLIGYPYGCLEQAASKAYALAYASREKLEKVGIKPLSLEEIQSRINQGMNRLGSLQKSNGGFGLWDSNSMEEQWLTAYVADFMLTARGNGYLVSEDMLSTTLMRLQNYVKRQGSFIRQRYSEDPKHYAIASKAYAAYLLSGLNQVTLGVLRTLYDKESDNAQTPLPLLHLGLALRQQGDRQRGDEAIAKALAMPGSDRSRYYGDYGSRIRDLGVMVHLLVKHDSHINMARELGFKLATELRGRRWLSTQERNALFLSGLALQGLPSKSWQVEIETDNDNFEIDGEGSYNRLLNAETIGDELMLTAKRGQGLYASISVSGYLNDPPAAEENGLSIRRHYFSSDGEELDLNQIKSGDLVLVDVVLSASQRTPDALLVDLLPAGFELENQNLDTAVSLDQFRIQGESVATLQNRVEIVYQEFRDDRYVAAVDLNAYRESHIIYLLRAVTPGSYAVPAPFVEDMYRPEIRAIGETINSLTIHEKP